MPDSKRVLSPVAGCGGFWLIAPYALWMVMMTILPQTAFFYAVRGAATALLLAVAAYRFGLKRVKDALFKPGALRSYGVGVLVGLVVLLVWIAPEMWFGVGQRVQAADSPYSPEVCGLYLTIIKLAASAFVISIAEELFFRKWVVDFAGFWWMVVLFAVEHGDRWHVGAFTGIVYGLAARRYGLRAAIVAHIVTNFLLGVIVVGCGRWQFW